jgi:flagellar biosynthetic protein FliO
VTVKTVKIVVLSLAMLASLAAPTVADANEPLHSATPPTNSVLSRDSNFALGSDRQFGTGGIYWRMMLAVILVLALGIGVYYVSKKLGSKIINLPNRQIKLVETLYMGSRKALHLIKVGNKNIIIGTTPTTITRIADLDRSISDSSVDKPK